MCRLKKRTGNRIGDMKKYLVSFELLYKKPQSARYEDCYYGAGTTVCKKDIFYAHNENDLEYKVSNTYLGSAEVINLVIIDHRPCKF